MTGILRAQIRPGKARAALGRGLLAVAVLVGDNLHFDTGDQWVAGAGLAAQIAVSGALVAVASRVGRSFAACVALRQVPTWMVVYGVATFAAPQPTGIAAERVRMWARIDGRQPTAAQPCGDASVLIAWSPGFVTVCARPSIETQMSWVPTDGAWVFRPW